jgi:hypothetical protein
MLQKWKFSRPSSLFRAHVSQHCASQLLLIRLDVICGVPYTVCPTTAKNSYCRGISRVGQVIVIVIVAVFTVIILFIMNDE